MLKFLTGLLGLVMLILRRILGRRKPPKTAKDTLAADSPTAAAVEEGEAKAAGKFGPRP